MRAPAFYALKAGGWHDYLNLLHLPYLIWHLSYVMVGAAAAPRIHADRLVATLVAFGLAVGISSHALDELKGRPLQTKILRSHLMCLAASTFATAAALGVTGAVVLDRWLLVFVGAGAFLAVAYNLEIMGGRFHNRFWFGLSWGAFPVLTSYWVQKGSISYVAILVAAVCLMLALIQNYFSRRAKSIRRSVKPPDEIEIRRMKSYERALRGMAFAIPIVVTCLFIARLGR